MFFTPAVSCVVVDHTLGETLFLFFLLANHQPPLQISLMANLSHSNTAQLPVSALHLLICHKRSFSPCCYNLPPARCSIATSCCISISSLLILASFLSKEVNSHPHISQCCTFDIICYVVRLEWLPWQYAARLLIAGCS